MICSSLTPLKTSPAHVLRIRIPLGVRYDPGAVECLTSLPQPSPIPVSFLARYRRNVVLIISIVAVLMAIASGWTCHVHTREWSALAFSQGLPRVVRLIETDAEAVQELQDFLKTTLGASTINMQMALLVPQVSWAVTTLTTSFQPLPLSASCPFP